MQVPLSKFFLSEISVRYSFKESKKILETLAVSNAFSFMFLHVFLNCSPRNRARLSIIWKSSFTVKSIWISNYNLKNSSTHHSSKRLSFSLLNHFILLNFIGILSRIENAALHSGLPFFPRNFGWISYWLLRTCFKAPPKNFRLWISYYAPCSCLTLCILFSQAALHQTVKI